MSTQQQKGNNGTAQTKPEGSGQKVATVVTLPKKEEEKKTVVAETKLSDKTPVEDRVLKIQQLFDLTTKREKLQVSLKKLKSINASTDNRELKIAIEDGDEEWETYNTEAIKSAIACMETTIKSKLQEVESQINI